MSKRRPEVWLTHKGTLPKIVSRSTDGRFNGPARKPDVFEVEVWSTVKGPVLKPVTRSTNGRFM
jgi:hypothetical protein